MTTVISILKLVAILTAAIVIGNWYQAQTRKIRAEGKPWYKIYASLPGILIFVIILLPVILWLLR